MGALCPTPYGRRPTDRQRCATHQRVGDPVHLRANCRIRPYVWPGRVSLRRHISCSGHCARCGRGVKAAARFGLGSGCCGSEVSGRFAARAEHHHAHLVSKPHDQQPPGMRCDPLPRSTPANQCTRGLPVEYGRTWFAVNRITRAFETRSVIARTLGAELACRHSRIA